VIWGKSVNCPISETTCLVLNGYHCLSYLEDAMKYLILLLLVAGCEEIQDEMETRAKYSSRAERVIKEEMECHFTKRGVCACVVTDFSFQGGTGIGLAIDPTGVSCDDRQTSNR